MNLALFLGDGVLDSLDVLTSLLEGAKDWNSKDLGDQHPII